MKIKPLLLTFLLAVLFGAVIPRQAEARVSFSYFYDSLLPYGEWVDVENYGYCWQPSGVDADWRPYTDGYWSYTDAGWTWVSYEDFGAITYHYGRWIRLEDSGWVWQPGYEWGPAWVSWRQSDDYIGWAPLPPEATFDPESGIGVWVDRDYDIGPSSYSFCEYRHFGAPVIRNYILPWRRNKAIIHSTVNITNITVLSNDSGARVVFNGGLDYLSISGRSEQPIERLHLMRQGDGDWARKHRSEISHKVGNQLFINAPEVEAPQKRFAPPAATVVRTIHAPKIDKGWNGVADPAERARIKQRFNDQTRGLTRTTAPAQPVDAVQVQTTINAPHVHQNIKPQESVVAPTPQVQQQQIEPQRRHGKLQEIPAAPIQQQPTPQQHQNVNKPQEPVVAPTPQVQQQQIEPQRRHGKLQEIPAAPIQQQPTPQQHQNVNKPQEPVVVPVPQVQQQVEQQRQAAEAKYRAAQEQQAQKIQQAKQRVEQEQQAAGARDRAVQEQQAKVQRIQAQQQQAEKIQQAQQQQVQAKQQAEQQREESRRHPVQKPQEAIQHQVLPQPQVPQGQKSPTPDNEDHKKKHKDQDNN